jgi:predicted metalloprotease with PDZ domain
MKVFKFTALAFCTGLLLSQAYAQNPAIRIQVDASDAPRRILHSELQLPVRAGKLTLLYPKWIPGEHGPNGPITDVVGLKMAAANKPVAWERDPEDMFAFNVEVPDGADVLDVAFDLLMPSASGAYSSGASASDNLVVVSWNQVVLYPKGAKASELTYVSSLKLPNGWKFGTALPVASESAPTIQFSPVSLEKLVDSPVLAGVYFRTLDLTPGAEPGHFIHVAADSTAALEVKPETTRHFSQLVAETGALFGARHYESYHFLLSLSDHVEHFGLEHHESSDDRTAENYLTDDDSLKGFAILLPHEMTHSWNGKYRRPAGLATPDYHQPMKGDLLWVYEGLTDYLGAVLAARCGLWTNNSTFREYLALEAANLDHQQGRKWRPLSDTTAAAQLLYLARPEGASRRRRVDFYPEGDLIWLEADVLIRQQTHGQRSLNDFCSRFAGGASSPPKVVPYSLDEVVATLNEVVSYTWREFFQTRVYHVNPGAPLGGIVNGGWKLDYTNTVPEYLKVHEASDKSTDLQFSLGLTVKEDGYILDVVGDSPADKAGLSPAMKLVAVNGRRWTPELLRTATKATAGGQPIELLIENEDFFKSYSLDYHGGERYPVLIRDETKPDLLSEILKPLTPSL